MRFVFNLSEVANALQLDETELRGLLPQLYDKGFPHPLKVLNEKWSILDVMNWVNNHNDNEEHMPEQPKRVDPVIIN